MRPGARIALLALAVTTSSSSAAPDDRRAKVAVRVGTRTVTVGELEDRLAGVAPVQLSVFGAKKEDVVRAYVDQVVLRDLMLTTAAEERGLDKELPTSYLLRRALSGATLRALRASTAPASAISDADVTKYYEDHRAQFEAPERVNLWRILVKTRDEAAGIIEANKREPAIPKWNEIAREKSLDKATYLRGGNLGFVAADGVSNEAGLRVDPALPAAALKVKDGEIVPSPVAEGENFAVVWRRATVAATKRSEKDASAQIRTTLHRERTEASEKALIAELRAKNVHDVDEGALAIIDLGAMDAGINLPRMTPRLPARDAH